jgi:hypothetical protein
MSEFDAANRASTERLERVIARLGGRDLELGDGWTSSALLAHIAFWDRLAGARWERRLDGRGEYPGMGIQHLELVNAASLPAWRALGPQAAADEALHAARAFDETVAHIGEADLTRAAVQSRTFVDRSGHRNTHLDAIERALG